MLYTNKIKNIAHSKGLTTQEEIAQKAGISVNTLQNFINNKNPKLETIERVSRALGVSPVVWFQDEDWIIEEKKPVYNKRDQSEINRLNLIIDELREDKRMLKERIDELKMKLGLGKVGA